MASVPGRFLTKRTIMIIGATVLVVVVLAATGVLENIRAWRVEQQKKA